MFKTLLRLKNAIHVEVNYIELSTKSTIARYLTIC